MASQPDTDADSSQPTMKDSVRITPLTKDFWTRPNNILWLCLAGLFVWSYWPTMKAMENNWATVDDYFYGFLVVPLAVTMLWWRSTTRPVLTADIHWGGLALIAVAAAMRLISSK